VVNLCHFRLGMKRLNSHDVSSFEDFPGEEETFVRPAYRS
jgi:hypothetical protein